jgi:hypothetical protein
MSLKAKTKKPAYSPAKNTQNEQLLWKNLEKALNKNASIETQKYLALWLGNFVQDKQAPLAQSLKVIDSQSLNREVNTFLASRYSKNQSSWESTALHQILRKMRKDGNINQHSKHELSPLYPIS